jgi:hypothetical protein
MSTSLLIEFAAFTHLAEGQILCATEDDDDDNDNDNNNLYWASSIVTDKTVDFNKPRYSAQR